MSFAQQNDTYLEVLKTSKLNDIWYGIFFQNCVGVRLLGNRDTNITNLNDSYCHSKSKYKRYVKKWEKSFLKIKNQIIQHINNNDSDEEELIIEYMSNLEQIYKKTSSRTKKFVLQYVHIRLLSYLIKNTSIIKDNPINSIVTNNSWLILHQSNYLWYNINFQYPKSRWIVTERADSIINEMGVSYSYISYNFSNLWYDSFFNIWFTKNWQNTNQWSAGYIFLKNDNNMTIFLSTKYKEEFWNQKNFEPIIKSLSISNTKK